MAEATNIGSLNTTDSSHPSAKNSTKGVLRAPDGFIWGIFIVLCLLSLLETYSASSREVSKAGIYMPIIKHFLFLCVGTVIVLALQRIPYQKFLKWIPIFGILTIGLLGYTELFGETINGAKRAIPVLGFTIQPAEMAKLGVVLLIAWSMGKAQMPKGVKNGGVLISAACVAIFGFFILKQGLTNTILLMAISISMMVICGVQPKKLGVVGIVYAVIFMVFFIIKSSDDSNPPLGNNEINTSSKVEAGKLERKSTWRARLDRFSNSKPLYEQPITSINQQEMYSRMAQANGGVVGVFPGNSRECSRLPLAFSDYIYSIIIEETGFIGGLFVLILYLCLFARAGNIASKCNRAVPALLVMGMAVMIVFQALFHMAINTGVFPVSGQPLPLISKGGTSILVTCAAFGIMLSVSRTATMGKKSKETKTEINNLPEDMQGANQGMIN